MDEANRGLVVTVCLGDTSLSEESLISGLLNFPDVRIFWLVSGTHFAGFRGCFALCVKDDIAEQEERNGNLFHICVLIAGITGGSESVTRAAFMSSAAFCG